MAWAWGTWGQNGGPLSLPWAGPGVLGGPGLGSWSVACSRFPLGDLSGSGNQGKVMALDQTTFKIIPSIKVNDSMIVIHPFIHLVNVF